MRLCTTLALTLMCAFAVPMSARTPAEWTLEERLAKRFNEADIAERDRAHRAAHPQLENAEGATIKHLPAGERMVAYVIDGSRDPELFLPHELFDGLLTAIRAEEPVRTKQREFYRAGILQFFGDDMVFWTELDQLAAGYTSLAEPARDERCRARFAALENAREHFGVARFDEFLYEVIAPSSGAAYVGDSTSEAEVRRQAEGCQP